jgi:hypothetical protein
MTIGYTNYTNLDARFGRGYEPGDRLVKGFTGELAVSLYEHLDNPTYVILNDLFARHNRDDRPDGRLCPSMSVGDVVVIGEIAWTVMREGWSPVILDPADLITDRTWSEVDR